jgi:hypothetical protein
MGRTRKKARTNIVLNGLQYQFPASFETPQCEHLKAVFFQIKETFQLQCNLLIKIFLNRVFTLIKPVFVVFMTSFEPKHKAYSRLYMCPHTQKLSRKQGTLTSETKETHRRFHDHVTSFLCKLTNHRVFVLASKQSVFLHMIF